LKTFWTGWCDEQRPDGAVTHAGHTLATMLTSAITTLPNVPLPAGVATVDAWQP